MTRRPGSFDRVVLVAAYAVVLLAPIALIAGVVKAGPRGLLVVFADALGFAALSLLALQVVVSGRSSTTTRAFGLRPVLALHRQAGVAVLVLVVVHVVALLADDPSRLALFDVATAPGRARAGVLALAGLVALPLLTVWRARMGVSYEGWRGLHLALTAVVVGAAFAHVMWVHAYTSVAGRALVGGGARPRHGRGAVLDPRREALRHRRPALLARRAGLARRARPHRPRRAAPPRAPRPRALGRPAVRPARDGGGGRAHAAAPGHASGHHSGRGLRVGATVRHSCRPAQGAPMKAVTWNEPDAAPAPRDDLPEPTAGPGQVVVRVHASSLNPVDNAIAAGMLQGVMPHEFPVTLGRDLAGTVESVGDRVSAYASGDAVLGMVPAIGATMHDGAWAELVAISEALIAPVPDGVDTAIAGAAPLVTVTGLMCVEAISPSADETVLVIGAAGGVGTVVVQLAAAAGARVVAPGLPEDEAYLRDLGAAEVLPRDGDMPDGVDAIVDLVGSGADAFDAVLRDGGRVASAVNSAGEGPGRTNVQSSAAEPEHFRRVSQLLADGNLKIPIQASYELAQAVEGLQDLANEHTQGKRALRIP